MVSFLLKTIIIKKPILKLAIPKPTTASFMNFILWLILFCCLLLNSSISAQHQYIAQTHTLNIADGLLSNTINVIYEDSRGIVWIGTDYGLNSYDGINLLSYTKKENGLSGDLIQNIQEDVHGNIWITCLNQRRGVFLFNVLNPIDQSIQTVRKYCPIASSFKNIQIQRVLQNFDHTIWFVSHNNLIYEYNGDSIVMLTQLNSSRKYIYNLCKKNDTELSMTTRSKTSKPAFETIVSYNYKEHKVLKEIKLDEALDDPIYRPSSKKDYWVNVQDSLISIYTNTQSKPIYQTTWSEGYFIKKNKHSFFIGKGEQLEVIKDDGSSLQQIKTEERLFKKAIYIDNRNGIWYKDYKHEALRYLRYAPTPFQAFDFAEGNPTELFRGGRGIVKLQDSLLFVGSIIGYKKKRLNSSLKLHAIPRGIFGVTTTKRNEFWIGIESGNAILIDSTGKQLLRPISLNNYEITWIVREDQARNVWAGTNQGLASLDRKRNLFVPVTQYNEFPKLAQSAIFYIYEKGNVLYLCTSSGLYLWDKKEGAKACFFKNKSIAHLYEDQEGLFWLASKGSGLIQFDPKTTESNSFTTKDGLAHNVLYAVYEDNYNNLWLSSNWGIMCFDKSTKSVSNYVKENGLLGNEFNTSSHYQDKDGSIYFGSQSGIVLFHPKNFQTTQDTFPLVLTQASKFNSKTQTDENILPTLLATNRIKLYPNDESIQLTAALLDYRNPKLHQYAYKIEGSSNKWRYQLDPFISINQLPYGDYNLKIKVKGISGNWVLLPQSIQISVYKPFYFQVWFILFALAATMGLILSIFKLRTKQLLQRQQKLEEVIKVRTKKIAQQTEDLKSLDQAKSKFFANISHELRTPLTLIIGPLSFLLDKIKRQEITEKEVESGLFSIQKNSKHLLSLVEEILDLSKMENNELETYEDTIHLKTYVQSVFESFTKQADYIGINYTLEEVLEDDLYVLLDENKVTKLLNNLLSNALKFTPAKASVTFIIKEKNAEIEFIVQDTGSGIHPDDLPHIFERFFQSKQANRPAQGGTGIGLALVFEFTQLLQGEVTVDSTLNKGTCFNVLLPKNSIAPSSKLLEQENATIEFAMDEVIETDTIVPSGSFTILLVEDHAEMRDFVTQILSTKYRILIARNGLEGLETLKTASETIDLIISDVMMPKMDGFEMLQQIKALPKWAYTPMIMLTARAAEQDKLQALTIGVDDYLTKPFSVEELKARIKNLLSNVLHRKEYLEELSELAVPNSDLDKIVSQTPPKVEQALGATPNFREADLAWIKEVENLMLEEVDNESASISDFAQKLHLSERHFSRKLKQMTGMSPAKMFKTVRLNLARTYLETGKFKTVKEIAYSTGFQTVGNFSKSYKKEYGKLPSTYFHTNTK